MRGMVGVGYFPDELHALMLDDVARSEEHANRWTHILLFELLPLRQELPGTGPLHARVQELSLYDYAEVRLAIEKVLRGDIADAEQMAKYAAQRRLELYQARFDKDLQKRLEEGIAQVKQSLQESYAQQVQGVQEQTARRYESQVHLLQQQLDDLNKRYQEIVKEVAKRPEIVVKREKELQQKLQETEEERKRLESLKFQVQEEVSITKLRLEEDVKRQLEEARREQRAAMDQNLAEERAEWEAYYAQKDQERQFQTKATAQQIVVNTTKKLAESQLSLLHLISPGILPNVIQLQEPEMMGLLAQVQAIRETLASTEEKLLHGNIVFSSEAERRSSDGYPSFN